MSFVKTRASFYYTTALLLVGCALHAQQRMGIAAGVVELAENGVSSVPTYCLDYSRRTPMPSDSYGRVLSSDSQTIVTVGSEQMSLQQALDRQLISIEGQHLSVADFLGLLSDPHVQERMRMPPDLRRESAALGSIYRTGTPAVRREIETQLAPLIQDLGDHTHLQFKNHTHERVRVEVLQNAALGARPEDRSEDLLLSGFGSAKSAEEQRAIQVKSWTMGLQKKLTDLGYYNGTVDGVAGPNTQRAIRSFQDDRGLARLNNHDTDAALNIALEHKRIEESNPGVLMATLIHHPGGEQRYTLSTASGGKAFSTSSMTDLAAKLNEHVAAASASNAYVELEGFSPDEADAMVFNLRNGERNLNSGIDVQGVYRGEGGDLESLLFRRNLTVNSRDVKFEQVTEGPRKGWFSSSIEFVAKVANRTKIITLRLYAKTRALAEDWTNTLLATIGRSSREGAPGEFAIDPSASIADLVRQASQSFRSRHPGIRNTEFAAEVRDMTGAVQVVRLTYEYIAA